MEKVRKYLILLALLAVGYGGAYYYYTRAQRFKSERDSYRHNTEVLMTDCRRYKVRDSLSAIKTEALELTLSEYKRWRSDDAALIGDLKLRLKDLSAVNAAQMETIISLRAIPKDTIVLWRDSILTHATKVHCGDAWFDFDGLLVDGEFAGALACRDSLLVVESVEYRRFLGFLWRTRKIKSKDVDVVSRSPYTTILGVEYIEIRK